MPSRRPSLGRPARASAWSRTTISCSSGRRSYRVSYRGNRASDENRTRPLCLDRAAFPPGNLGGKWGDRRVSIPDLLVHSQPCRAATPRPPRSSASRESNPRQPVIGRPHCHCARGGCCELSERPELNRLRPVPETGASPIGYAPSRDGQRGRGRTDDLLVPGQARFHCATRCW